MTRTHLYKALLPSWLLCLLSILTKTIGWVLIPGCYNCIAQPRSYPGLVAAGKNWEVQKKEFADCGSLADLKMRWALGSLLLALVHHSSSSARRNSRRMLISEAPTASEYVNVQEGRQGRQIQPLACVSKSGGEKGVCMFAWNCVEAGGQHLGTCIDRFVSLSQKYDRYS